MIGVSGTSSSNLCSSANVLARTTLGSFSSPRKKTKKSKIRPAANAESSSDSHSDEDEVDRLLDTIKTPTFRGRRLIHGATNDSTTSQKLAETDSFFQRIETKYLAPLAVAQERLEKMIKSIYKNQMKIQKALNKRQVFSTSSKYLFKLLREEITNFFD